MSAPLPGPTWEGTTGPGSDLRRYLRGGLIAGAAYPALHLVFVGAAAGIASGPVLGGAALAAGGTGFAVAIARSWRDRRHPVALYTWGGCLLYLAGQLSMFVPRIDAAWTVAVGFLALGGAVAAALFADGTAAPLVAWPLAIWFAPGTLLGGSIPPWSLVGLQSFLVATAAVIAIIHALTPFNERRLAAVGGFAVIAGIALVSAGAAIGGISPRVWVTALAWVAAPPAIAVAGVVRDLRAGGDAAGYLRDSSRTRAKSY